VLEGEVELRMGYDEGGLWALFPDFEDDGIVWEWLEEGEGRSGELLDEEGSPTVDNTGAPTHDTPL
jgi:hypothetical protein